MILEYDFTKMTEKDIFEMKLKGTIPDFGYISETKRVPFLKFLMENNFIKRTTVIEDNDLFFGRWMPYIDFRFTRMFTFNPNPVIVHKGNEVYIDRSRRLANWKIKL